MELSFGSSKKDGDKKQSSTSFSSSPHNPNLSGNSSQILEDLAAVNRRVKLIENSLSSLKATVQNLEKNLLESTKDNRKDIKTLEDENTELQDSLRTVKTTLKKIIEDMANTAKSEDVKVIQSYLNLWNPVKFVTAEQVKRLARDVFEDLIDEKRKAKLETKQQVSTHIAEIQERKQNL